MTILMCTTGKICSCVVKSVKVSLILKGNVILLLL